MSIDKSRKPAGIKEIASVLGISIAVAQAILNIALGPLQATVADRVTERAASDRHSESTFSWMMMTWPGSDRITCAIASAPLPLGRVMSVTYFHAVATSQWTRCVTSVVG